MSRAMSVIVVMLIAVVTVGVVSADGVGLSRTASGCVWPTGILDQAGRGAGFLLSGPQGYLSGKYHLGKDVMVSGAHPDHARVNDPVYAVCDGKVVLINVSDSWGSGNCAVLIKHQFQFGSAVVCYGHLQTDSLVFGLHQRVKAGEQIGRLGQWGYGVHCHFGVHTGDSIPTKNLGMADLSLGWQVGQPLDARGWVDPISWVQTQTPINEDTQVDSCPAWDSDANRLYFVRRGHGQQVWVSSSDGGYARPIWSVPESQEVKQLLSYQGKPLAVISHGGRSLIRQPDQNIKSLIGKGWLSQTLYHPSWGSWTWIPESGLVTNINPNGTEEEAGSFCSGVNVSWVREVTVECKQRRIPIVTKVEPGLPWKQFSWTVFTDFHEEFPVVVLKSGELWWTMMQAKYRLLDYQQNCIVEFWITKSVRLTSVKTHGQISEFSMAEPQRLYAVSGSCIWRLDFDGKGTRWRQVTGGNKTIVQAF